MSAAVVLACGEKKHGARMPRLRHHIYCSFLRSTFDQRGSGEVLMRFWEGSGAVALSGGHCHVD